MRDINRRDVLKGLGALTSVALAAGINAQREKRGQGDIPTTRTALPCATLFPRVNIVLHGMHALVFEKSVPRLKILIPNVPGHSFAAGNFGEELSLDANTTPYSLSNAPGGSAAPAPGRTDNVVVALSKGINYGDAPYCLFDLPWPDCIVPFRTYHLPNGVPLFLPGSTATDNQLGLVTSIPMINVLSYKLPSPSANLAGIRLKFDKNGVAHAHIIAEPAFKESSSMHVNKALSVLNLLFDSPLDLRINNIGKGQLDGPSNNEPGVSPAEQETNAELRQGGSICGCAVLDDRGGEPRNCMQVFVIKP